MNSAQVIAFQPAISVKNSKSIVIPMSVITSFPRIQNISIRDEPSLRLKSLKPLRAGGKGMNDEVYCIVSSSFQLQFLFLIAIVMDNIGCDTFDFNHEFAEEAFNRKSCSASIERDKLL